MVTLTFGIDICITSEGISVIKEDTIPTQFNWNKPFSSEDLNYNTIYTASVVSVVFKEKAADLVSIAVNVFKNDNKVGKPELVHKRIT